MMNLIVFVGPTLSVERARAVLDADFRPPAQQGDVYWASLDRPAAIGIIDGYFHCVPSVWHKEILAAMADGIHVFGSASMGALRAAELGPFGMEGVGAVFEAFRSGELEDDDEVAVTHASAAEGYRALSDAMVNVRATLSAAEAAGLLSTAQRGQLEAIAKGLHYADRAYPVLWKHAARAGIDRSVLEALEGWLPLHRVDQKQNDALRMLTRMHERFAVAAPTPKRVDYILSCTDGWEEAKRRVRQRQDRRPQPARPASTSDHGPSTAAASSSDGATAAVAEELILHELIVDGTLPSARAGAFARALAKAIAAEAASALAPEVVREASVRFRREHGLFTPEQFDRWLAAQRLLEEHEMNRFFRDEALLRRIEALFEADALRHLADHLRATNRYGAIVNRALAKQALLAELGTTALTPDDLGMTESEVWTVSGVPKPGSQGSPTGVSLDTVRNAILRELCFRRGEKSS